MSNSKDYYLCFLDFEATCWDPQQNRPKEIIEFPSILCGFDPEGKLVEVSRSQSYVKPTINPTLSKFCTELTGITQHKVDEGLSLKEALDQNFEWLRSHVTDLSSLYFVTIGDWDLDNCLPTDCKCKNLSYPHVYKRWINIKMEFEHFYKVKTGSLTVMLDHQKMKLEGRHHSGIDDCYNAFRICQRMVEDGYDPANSLIRTPKPKDNRAKNRKRNNNRNR